MKLRDMVLLLVGNFILIGCADNSGVSSAGNSQQLSELVELQKEQIDVTKDLITKLTQSNEELKKSNAELIEKLIRSSSNSKNNTESVEYEYATLKFANEWVDQRKKVFLVAECHMVYQKEEKKIYLSPVGSRKITVFRDNEEDFANWDPYSVYIEQVLNSQAKNGWFLDEIDSRSPSYKTLILKRVKQ